MVSTPLISGGQETGDEIEMAVPEGGVSETPEPGHDAVMEVLDDVREKAEIAALSVSAASDLPGSLARQDFIRKTDFFTYGMSELPVDEAISSRRREKAVLQLPEDETLRPIVEEINGILDAPEFDDEARNTLIEKLWQLYKGCHSESRYQKSVTDEDMKGNMPPEERQWAKTLSFIRGDFLSNQCTPFIFALGVDAKSSLADIEDEKYQVKTLKAVHLELFTRFEEESSSVGQRIREIQSCTERLEQAQTENARDRFLQEMARFYILCGQEVPQVLRNQLTQSTGENKE